MESKKYKLSIVFTSPVLGSQPGADTPASDFIRERVRKENPAANIEDEIPTLPEELQKGTTGFHRENGKPVFLNYQIKGLLKEAGEVMNGSHNMKALKSKIDNLVFVGPRFIPIETDKEITFCERSLRAMTMQGPRVSIARSEQIQEGAKFSCEITILETPKGTIPENLLRELLEYSTFKGFGQWRNSGFYGRFSYELIAVE